MKKLPTRMLALVLAVLMVFSAVSALEAPADAAPEAAPAAAEAPVAPAQLTALSAASLQTAPATATVNVTVQAEGAFLCAPQIALTVSGDLSAKYGFTSERLDDTVAVSALDVMLAAHEVVFGEDFTPATVGDYMIGDASYIISAFGGFADWSFAVNGQCPNDGVWNETYSAYTGYAIDQTAVKDGDLVELFAYQDGYYLDNYVTVAADKALTAATVCDEVELTVKGWCYCWYGCSTAETIAAMTEALEDAVPAWVDAETGALTTVNTATDEDGKVKITLPDTAGTHYLTIVADEDDTPAFLPLIPVTVTEPDGTKITVPADADFSIGRKDFTGYNYMTMTTVEPTATIAHADGTVSRYYEMVKNKEYYYRVSGESYVTYANWVKFNGTATPITVTAADLQPTGKTKTTVERDKTAQNGYNVADVYLNINPQGHLQMTTGGTYQIVNLRNWEAVNSVTANVFVEPDYHYTVVDENGNPSEVLTVSESGVITANQSGTALVLVTYDAMTYPQGIGGFFGAIWPENTGVFVVTVDAETPEFNTGMVANVGKNPADTTVGKLAGDSLDAELDVVYFVGEQGSYTFTPAAGTTVAVANPTVADAMTFHGFTSVTAQNGAFTVPLTEGRNIVKLENGGKTAYQVITAKKVTYTVNGGDPVHAGEAVTVVFDGIYHPVNKLAGVYNMNAGIVYTGFDGKLVGGTAAQYNFASNAAAQTVSGYVEKKAVGFNTLYAVTAPMSVPADAKGTVKLTNGTMSVIGFGDPYGNHRGITKEKGKAPNLNAAVKEGFLGILPDIEIPVTATTVTDVTIDTATVKKTGYYAGDKLDTTNLVVTATYSDGTTGKTMNYTVEPAVLTADTTAVTVTAYGKSVTIEGISVTELLVTKIAATKQPAKKTYTAGETFDPTGMVITATYNSKATAETFDYTYAPTVMTEGTTKVTVTYTGTDTTATRTVNITGIKVNAATGGGSTPTTVTVKFSLLGDTAHGESTTAHTLRKNNLTTWIPETEITVDEGSRVVDVIAKALGAAGIPYSNATGNYIDSVRGISEFTNGSRSGWMYTLNGSHPNLGVAEQTVKNGDVIVFHYTDDYAAEQGSESWGGAYAAPEKTEEKPEEKPEEKTEEKTEETTVTFTDVPADAYYADAVKWAVEKGITKGVDDSHFAPNAPCTRGQVVTLLWRAAGSPAAEKAPAFTDLPDGGDFAKAVAWAVEQQIVKGISESEFGTENTCTRGQLMTLLYRFNGFDTLNIKVNPYTDLQEGTYYYDAILWAKDFGVAKGMSDTTFAPDATCTRGQIVTFLHRYFTQK